ncbi:MAG: hypothetical protein QXV22_03860, partial [Thermoplasmataceae archaeon]
VSVSNSSLLYLIRYLPGNANLTLGFMEEGLPSGTTWYVTLGNITLRSNNSTIYFGSLSPGYYRFTVSEVYGFESIRSGVIELSGNYVVVVQYVPDINSLTYIFLGIGIAGGAVAGVVAVLALRKIR